jgi:putative membrane protein
VIKLNKVERNHILKVIFEFIKGICQDVIIIIAALSFLPSKVGDKAVFIIVTFIVIDLIWKFLQWNKNIFYIKNDSIFYQDGVVNITRREIPFDKVNTVDISQGIIDKLFKLSKIKIDTGSAISGESEISLLIKSERAFELRNILLKREESTVKVEQENKKYSITTKDLIVYALTSNAVLKGIGIIFALYNFLDDYISKLLEIDMIKSTENIVKMGIRDNMIIGAAIITIIVITVSIVLAVISSFLKYYNFNIYVDKEKLNIRYGFFYKKNYSFDINKIKGIHIKQSLIMQFFNTRTIEIESIGYGDEDGEKAILYPLCSEKFQDDLIRDILPQFLYDGSIDKAPKNAYSRFIFKKLIFSVLIVGFFIYKFQYGYLSCILLLVVTILGHMQFKNTALGMGDRLIFMSHSGFNKKQSIIKISAVQSLTMSYNYFQKRKGLCNFEINIFSNSFGSGIKVKNLRNKLIDELCDKNY